jgi:tRNA pseudouridine65 synthase
MGELQAPLEILYRDDALVAVAKPGGLLVHRTREANDRLFLLQEMRRQLGLFVYPVHRLDRAASGVLVFALSSDDARRLQAALGAADAVKEYLVLARGVTPERWEVDLPLSSDAGVKQPARTSFERLACFSRASLLKARLHTGRRHQIRRHLARSAHQVIGDTTHGKGRINRYLRENYGLPRLFLHAWRLRLRHPRTAAPLCIVCPLAPDLRAFLERLPDYDAAVLERLEGAGPAPPPPEAPPAD